MDELTNISLFTGAMGLDLGLEKAGFTTKVCVEKDEIFCETIQMNRPNIPLIPNDINDVTTEEILRKAGLRKGRVDLVAGGPPCQSFSTAGTRRAVSDPRGNLVYQFVRVVREARPRFFVMENVKGILSAALKHRGFYERESKPLEPDEEYGTVFKQIMTMYDEIGYKTRVYVLNSADYGVPQKRLRVFFLGSRDGIPLPAPQVTHTKNDGLLPKWRTLRDAFRGLDDSNPEYPEYSEERKKYLRLVPAGGSWVNLPKNMQKKAMGGAWGSQGGRRGFYRRLAWDKPSPTLVTWPTHKGSDMCHPEELRPLSIREYMRLQEFPDNWKLAGTMQARYMQIGNAVPIGLAAAAGGVIFGQLVSPEIVA